MPRVKIASALPDRDTIDAEIGLLRDLVEVGTTDDIFTNPQDKRTQDYITGRFG